ncbi:MAG: histidinol-phosphate transaminase [Chloroflexi bacterium]|nr:histidinol-phosphate transaminase [Chloroflexota bacterium]
MDNESRIRGLIRPDIWDIDPYAAVEPVERLAARVGVPVEQVIKLDANENPYGCSPEVQRALASFSRYHIYPDPLCSEMQEILQRYTGAAADRILIGSGSDEIIDILMRLFLRPGDKVIVCPPTFGYYQSSAAFCAAELVRVPRQGDYGIDVDGVVQAVDGATKLIFIASPNNPTGNTIGEHELRVMLETGVAVVVDEAYAEFSGKTVLPLTDEHDNLIVLRTFSKWAGLAGLRFGYGILPMVLVQQAIKMKPPYNVNLAAQIAVKASLEDIENLIDRVNTIRGERERLYNGLKELDYLLPHPSEANFILCRVVRGGLGRVRQALEGRGIFVRYYSDPLLDGCLRISVGTPDQNAVVLERLREIGSALTDE